MFNSKVFLAEFVGTFALVFIGISAGLGINQDLVGLALVYGLTVAVFVYAYGHISGAHINPAVTFGLALNGTIKWAQAVVYWVAQFAGAILGVFFLKTILESLGGDINSVVMVGALTDSQPIFAMVVEAVLAFLLVNTVLHTLADGKSSGVLAGGAIGATMVVVAVVGILFTGDIANPARTLASAIFAGPSLTNVYTYVIYLFGPLLGSTLAVIVFNFLNDTEKDNVEEEGEDVEEEEDVEPEK
ncbi:MAG: aquaporin [Chloroflexi bacterium]|nr:aquaporin [Chloroflexota bacterium]